jgi:two-component system, cell cycle sensor histidine kinase and response regulator CckA
MRRDMVCSMKRPKKSRSEIESLDRRLAYYQSLIHGMNRGFAVHEMIYDKDGNPVNYRFVEVNQAYEELTGLKDVTGKTILDVQPELRVKWIRRYNRLLETGTSDHFEYLSPVLSRWFEVWAFPLTHGLFAVVCTDINERIEAEQEKAHLQEQYNQAQKMESIGRLAGGVAHDFNNLLTTIIGYSDIIESSLDANDPLAEDVKEVLNAANRAAQLTSQLLAFSRKQTIDPRIINIDETVERSQKMLKRLIEASIDLQFTPKGGLWLTKFDPAQLDQILLNLVVNARDAMPNGGKLTIETSNVCIDEAYSAADESIRPGEFVMLGVSDNGCGMEKDVLRDIFEPFYTTKAMGTGLGLSTVFGIVKQHDGFIKVYSEPGEGTSFRLYLPRIQEDVEDTTAHVSEAPTAGSETILLAEDEDQVRKLAVRILTMNGYRVLEANDGGSAYLKCKEYKKDIDLLLTDVMMPEMNGKRLYEQIAPIRPGIKVLYLSGYTDNAIVHRGVLSPGEAFLQKPFRADDLLNKVREVLDRSL